MVLMGVRQAKSPKVCFKSIFSFAGPLGVRHQTMLLTMEDEARWMMENRLTQRTKAPNCLDYLHSEALLQASPKAVRLVIPDRMSPDSDQ